MPTIVRTIIDTPTYTVTAENTKTVTPEIIENIIDLLEPGNYLGVLVSNYINNAEGNIILLSTEGEILGNWLSINSGKKAYPSRTLHYMAYIENGDLKVFDTLSLLNKEFRIKKEECPGIRLTEYAVFNYSWSDNDDEIAIECGEFIIIYNIQEKRAEMKIESPINATPSPNQPVFINSPVNPKWSPDGKWISYMVEREHPSEPRAWYFGPYITDVDCLRHKQCVGITFPELIFKEQSEYGTLAWTSTNDMAFAPHLSQEIFIFDINNQTMVKKIMLPNDHEWNISGMEFSHDGEWIAIEDYGLYLYNITMKTVIKILDTSISSYFWISKN